MIINHLSVHLSISLKRATTIITQRMLHMNYFLIISFLCLLLNKMKTNQKRDETCLICGSETSQHSSAEQNRFYLLPVSACRCWGNAVCCCWRIPRKLSCCCLLTFFGLSVAACKSDPAGGRHSLPAGPDRLGMLATCGERLRAAAQRCSSAAEARRRDGYILSRTSGSVSSAWWKTKLHSRLINS